MVRVESQIADSTLLDKTLCLDFVGRYVTMMLRQRGAPLACDINAQ